MGCHSLSLGNIYARTSWCFSVCHHRHNFLFYSIEKMIRLFVKIVFLALFVVCAIVVYLMYSKLSFIDWPYVIAGLFFLALGLLPKRTKKKT